MLSIIPQTAYFGRVAKDLGTILFFDIDPYYLFVHLYVDMLTKKLRYTRVKVYANAQVPTQVPPVLLSIGSQEVAPQYIDS